MLQSPCLVTAIIRSYSTITHDVCVHNDYTFIL